MISMTGALVTTPDKAGPPARWFGLALVVGVLVGAATSWGQTVLGGSASAGLANAVSPWLVAPFLVGSTGRTRSSALVLGMITCVSEVAGYYLTAAARGFAINLVTVGIWVVGGLVGGLVFGLAGRSWRSGAGRERGLGAALLIAVWLSEAIVSYVIILGYFDDAVVFTATGVALWLWLGFHGRQHFSILVWLGPALGLAVMGELVLQAVM
jgi:hypothetical protein